VRLLHNIVNFGSKIFFNDTKKSTQNFTKQEDLVVLECVDRLLEKGYAPQNIILEKQWKTGHGTSGRLDILVTQDSEAYMMIECKTWGKEFDKEFANLEKNGGQLFTYFQQDKKAEILVLYASKLDGKNVAYKNEIIKIEEEYRTTSNVKDFYDRWNKLSKNNGVFESYAHVYAFVSKALSKEDLQVLKQEDSSFIFNRFLEILRHNVVSDKPNAFNKIFTLFLCKIIDEDRSDDEQLHFQWLEGEDTHISFQKRLSDLYTRGMKELLEKKVTDVSDSEFDKQFQQVDEEYKAKFKEMLTEIRLKKNNEFAIKEVYDDDSFNENAVVVKEIVELLQTYKIRYNYRQQFLSDFFELLLTTGLKQESGQFFTPVPLARFIIKSMPITQIVEEKVHKGDKSDLLPAIIDYAAGSGHFITESMEEVQKYIDTIDEGKLTPTSKRAIKSWKADPFDWAEDYVYGIEKDYRLVKTAKVSCYLHGDGLAKVIHGDGLADFSTAKEYKDRLKIADKTYTQDNKQFDVVISNPPYSVSSFKSMMDSEKSKESFTLYDRLTDQSSEIETLFIERTKQLLKDGGMAGIILPSSILSNTGIYTQTREIILSYFDIVSIVELGSNTFMATGTNTVILFLRRRNNADHLNCKASVEKLFTNKKDITINGVENPLQKYLGHVWEDMGVDDYFTLLDDVPNDILSEHELMKAYTKKLKGDISQQREQIILIEKEKLLYFIMAYPQRVTLVKTGEKKAEKKFLGYEFSNRRGSEGIHPTQKGSTIDECTSLYDESSYTNALKANSYIYSAFNGELKEIDKSLKDNISYVDLVDIMGFDRADFEKNISLNVKKKVNIESKWDQVKVEDLTVLIKRGKSAKYGKSKIQIIKSGQARGHKKFDFREKHFVVENFLMDERKLEKGDLLINSSGVGTAGRVTLFTLDGTFVADSHITIVRLNQNKILPEYALACFVKIGFKTLESLALGQSGQIEMTIDTIGNIKIPLPPKEIQEKIVNEIEVLEESEKEKKIEIRNSKNDISKIINDLKTSKFYSIEEISQNLDNKRKPVTAGHRKSGKYPYYGASGIVDYVSGYLIDDTVLLISEDGANLKSRVYPIAFTSSGKIWVNNHAHILKFQHIETHKLTELYINNTDLSEYITGQAQPKLNQKNLNSIKIPLPAIEEQKKIVKEIEIIEKKIQQKEEALAAIPQQKEAILKKYL